MLTHDKTVWGRFLLKHWKFWLVFACVIAYVFLIEPNILTVERLTFSDDPSVKIAFFADIHIWTKKPLHDRILEKFADEGVDLILFGGDVLAPYTDMEYMERFLSELTAIAPVYAVYGNWEESETTTMQKVYEEAGINVVHANSAKIQISDKKLGLTGTPSHHYFSWTKFLPEDDYDLKILMVHAPNLLEEREDVLKDFDLVLAGHTHGGQFYIPWLTEAILKSTRRFSGDFFRGLYQINGTKVFVTRGVGGWFPGRLASLPELVFIEF